MKTKIIVAMRVHAGGNAKPRPVWFSKTLCIQSLNASVEHARSQGIDVKSVAFVDLAGGPLSADEQRAVDMFDVAVPYHAGSSRRSWQRHLRLLRDVPGAAEAEAVYLVEDDHLHRRDAIQALTSMPSDYGLLYSISKQEELELLALPHRWVETLGGVSSFAVRGKAFQRDFWLLWVMAYAGPAFDLLTWRVVRGRSPFSIAEIASPFRPKPPFERTTVPKAAYQSAWRLLASGLSIARPRRVLSATSPSLATHAEQGWLASGVDWRRVAEDCSP
jgi:hypothetical protein